MKSILNIVISAVVATIVAIAVVAVVGNSQPQANSVGASGTRFPNGLSTTSTSPSAGEVRTTTLTVGSTADITGDVSITADTFDIGGVNYQSVQQDFTSGTTTPCSIQNPFSATSTLISYIANISTASTTMLRLTLATSTTAFATTTSQTTNTVQANTPTYTAITTPIQMSASNYINVGLQAVNGEDSRGTLETGNSGSVVTGTCSALFIAP